jgi:hypothetical protein
MARGKRILSSVILFFALILVFRSSVLETRCPAISCEPPTGCIGGCYSYVNVLIFIAILFVSIILPGPLYKLYARSR